MKAIIQRVAQASVITDNQVVGTIDAGLLVLLGITHSDTQKEIELLVQKIITMRIFPDENDKMNVSLQDINGSLLVVSQFTLYADCKKGNRPSFIEAAKPEQAEKLYNFFIESCKKSGVNTQSGKFGAMMQVHLINDGPVTIILEA